MDWLDARLALCACEANLETRFRGRSLDARNAGRLCSRVFEVGCCHLWIRSVGPNDESISTVTTTVGLVAGWSDSAGEDARCQCPVEVLDGRTSRWS